MGIALAQGHAGMALFQQGNLEDALGYFKMQYDISKQFFLTMFRFYSHHLRAGVHT